MPADAPDAPCYQLPDAPPPPKLPPPPLKPPPPPELPPPTPAAEPPPPGRRRDRGRAEHEGAHERREQERKHADRRATATPTREPRQQRRRRRRSPAEPTSRPSSAAQHAADRQTAMKRNGLNRSTVGTAPLRASAAAPAAGSFSPSMTRIIRSTPAEMPPAKSPGLELRRDVLVDDALGGDVGERAFEAVADLDAQRAVVLGDDEQRAVVDLLAADLPVLRRRGSKIARSPPPSVVGTISTAIWLPLRVSRCLQRLRPARRLSPPCSVPVWSTTRPVSGGTATCGQRPRQPSTAAAQASKALAAFIAAVICSSPLLRRRAGAGLKSTFGAVEIAFSFSTVKFGFSL